MDFKPEQLIAFELEAQASDIVHAAQALIQLAKTNITNVEKLLEKPQPRPELAAYIVDNRSYNTTLTTALLKYLDVLAKSGVRRVILWQNKQQLAAGFMQQALDRGLAWDLDTVYKLRTLTTDMEFAKCLEQAEAMNVQAYRFDDAHNQQPEELAKVIAFMRKFTDKPIIGSFGALDERKNKTTGKIEPIDMQAYQQAGLTIFRQFYRHDQVDSTPDNPERYDPTQVISNWLASGRITDGIDLEAYKEGTILTSVSDFDSMFLRAMNAGMRDFTIYAVVNEAKFVMWQHAPALWQAVQRAARTLRTLK